MRTRVRATVDLPEPDSPASPRVSPAAIVNETPSTALTLAAEQAAVHLEVHPQVADVDDRRAAAARRRGSGRGVAAAGEAAWRSVVAP